MNFAKITADARCPFFMHIARTRHGQFTGIECEGLTDADKLGFRVTSIQRMSASDMEDYAEIFCCDLYESCPYFMAMTALRYGQQ